MESAPEQAGSTDEVDGGLISKFTAGTSKVPTNTDGDASTTTSCVMEASQDTNDVNNNEESINEDVVFSNNRCGERSSGSHEQEPDVADETVSAVEEESHSSFEAEVVKETSNTSEQEGSSDKSDECMEVSELSPAKSSTAEGPQVGQVSTTTESPSNLPVVSMEDQGSSTEQHDVVSPSSDTAVHDYSTNSEDLTAPTTTTDPSETTSPHKINEKTDTDYVTLNNAHHAVSSCESTILPHVSSNVLPSTQSHSLDELPSSSTSEDYSTKLLESSHDVVCHTEQTMRNDTDITTTNEQFVNESTMAVEEDSFVGSDTSGASIEVHASKSLIVSSVSDIPSDDAMPSPSALSKDGEHSSIASDVDGEPPDLKTTQDDRVTNTADSMLNEALPRSVHTSSPKNVATTVDSTTGSINHQTELNDVCNSRVQNKADSPGFEEEVTESVSATKLQQHFDDEEDIVESSSEEASAVKSPEDEMFPEDQQMPTSIQLHEDSSVLKQSSNNNIAAGSSCSESCEPADGETPMESESTTSELQCEELQNASVGLSHEQMSDIETTVQPESMDVTSPSQTEVSHKPEPMEESVSLSHPDDDDDATVASSHENVTTSPKSSADKTMPELPDTTGTVQVSRQDDPSGDDVVTSPTDVSSPVVSTKNNDADVNTETGEVHELPKLGLVDYPGSPDESEKGDDTNNDVSETVQDLLPAPHSPAVSTASTPSSASLSSLDELPDETAAAGDIVLEEHVVDTLPEEGLPDQVNKEPLVESHQTRSTSLEPQVRSPKPQLRSPEPQVRSSEQQVRSPEQQVKSPEPQVRSPEPQVRSPEPQVKSPELQVKSPEPQIKSPEPQIKSPEPQVISPEPQVRSPEPQVRSPELRVRSPEPRVRSPEPQVRSPEPQVISPEPRPSESQTKLSEQVVSPVVEMESSDLQVGSPQTPCEPEPQTELAEQLSEPTEQPPEVKMKDEDDVTMKCSSDTIEESTSDITPLDTVVQGSTMSGDMQCNITTKVPDSSTAAAQGEDDDQLTDSDDELSSMEGIEPFERIERDSMSAEPTTTTGEASMDTTKEEEVIGELENDAAAKSVSDDVTIAEQPEHEASEQMDASVSSLPLEDSHFQPVNDSEVSQSVVVQKSPDRGINGAVSSQVVDSVKTSDHLLSQDLPESTHQLESDEKSPEAVPHNQQAGLHNQEIESKYQEAESLDQETASHDQEAEFSDQIVESEEAEAHHQETRFVDQEADQVAKSDNHEVELGDQKVEATSHNQAAISLDQETQCLNQDAESYDQKARFENLEAGSLNQEDEPCNQEAESHDLTAESHGQGAECLDQGVASHNPEARFEDQEVQSRNAESLNQEAGSQDQEAESNYQKSETEDLVTEYFNQNAKTHDQEDESYDREAECLHQDVESYNQEARFYNQEADSHDLEAVSCDQGGDLPLISEMETEQGVEELQKDTSKMSLSEDTNTAADEMNRDLPEASDVTFDPEMETHNQEVDPIAVDNVTSCDMQPQDAITTSPGVVTESSGTSLLTAEAQTESLEPVESTTTSGNLPHSETEDNMTNEAVPLMVDIAPEVSHERDAEETSPKEEESLNEVSMDDNEAMEDTEPQETVSESFKCDDDNEQTCNEAASTSEHTVEQPVVDNVGRRSSSPAEVSCAEITDNLEHRESSLQPEESNFEPVESSLQPEESNFEPVESSLQPEESSFEPVESSLQPEESSIEPVESSLQPEESGLNSVESGLGPAESSNKPAESGLEPGESSMEPNLEQGESELEQVESKFKEPVDSSLSDEEIQDDQVSEKPADSVNPEIINDSDVLLDSHPSNANVTSPPTEDNVPMEIIQDDNISSNTGEAVEPSGPVTTEDTSNAVEFSQVHSSIVEAETVGQGDPDTASSATEELDVERVAEEDASGLQQEVQPMTDISTVTGGESEDSDESSDSSSSDSDSDDNQSSSSSSSQEDRIEITVVAEMNTNVVSTGEVNSALPAEPEKDTSTVKEHSEDISEDVTISKVESEFNKQQQQQQHQEVSEIGQQFDKDVIQEESQPEQPKVTEDQAHKAEETPAKSQATRMPPRPIPADSMETWRSLGNDSNTSKSIDQGSTSVIASTSVGQTDTIGHYLQQYKSQIVQEFSSKEAQRAATQNDLQKVAEAVKIQSLQFQGLSEKAQYLSKYHPSSGGIPSMSGSAQTATTMANYRPVIATSETANKVPSESSGNEQPESLRASGAVEKIAGRLVQLTPGGDFRTSSTSMETGSASGDNLDSPLHKGLTKDKFSLERVGGDSHGNVYWYDGGKNLYQTTTDFIVTPENMASLAPICNSMNKWLAKLKSLRSSGSDDDLELVKHIKEHYIHRVHQAVQRRRSKISGDAAMKQSQHQMSYTSSAAIQNFTGNIQKQLAAAVAATEITTAATTVVSTSAVATVVTQAPTKVVKQISSANSSRSASPQVTVPYQQQQYIIQHQPQQALYSMGLGQLGAIIPGPMPQVDPSKTNSQSSTPITTTTTNSEQPKTDRESPLVSNLSAAIKDEESIKRSTPSSVTTHSVIQATPTVSVEKSRHSSVTSIASVSTSMVSSSASTPVASTTASGSVIMNPYQYYAIAATAASSMASTSTPSNTKEKIITSTATASSKSAATSSVSTTVQSSVATPTAMSTQQMQYAVVNAGGQQQLYAMPSGAQIQTGYLFFQQPNGMMVAIPAQTVVQPGGSTQVAIAPQQLAALSGGAVAIQQQQQPKTTTTSAENTDEKTKESDTTSSTSTSQKQQQVHVPMPAMQQVHVPMPAMQQYELNKPLTTKSSKGKRSSSSSVSEDFQKGSKDQHHMKHHSTTPTSAAGFKYSSPLYIPRGAHAYRVAAAQASAAAAMGTQQSSSDTTTTSVTATTITSTTTLEKTKETEEVGASSLVPIQLVQQSQYAKEQHGVIQQHKQATTTSATTTISSTGSSTTSTSQSKMTVPAMYGGLAVAGRTGMLLNAAGGTAASGAPHMQQMMLRAVAQGPSGVYEVKASSLADIDPASVKNLTEKYEHKIVKMDLQTALITRTENDTSLSTESGGKEDKTLLSASHKGLVDQLPNTGDETTTAMQQTVEHKDETTKPATKKRSRAKKPVQADGTEPTVDKTMTSANDTSAKPPTAATRKRKGAKEEEGEQEVTQAAKRKRGPNKKKSAAADESLGTEEESKPTKTPATQRGKKGKATNETAKGALKSAVVSISLEALADVPSPQELDEEQNKSGRKRKLPNEDHSLQGSMSRKAKAALLAAHKTCKDPKLDIDELSGINPEALDFSVLNEITGEEFQEEKSPDTTSRQKRKCVAVRERVTKLHQMLEKAQMANQKAANATSGRKKRTPQPTASAPVDDDDIAAILPVSKPAPKKNRFPFSSSRSRRHRRKREEPLWQSASQKGGRFTRNAKCKAVYVFSTHLANEASKAVMTKTHKSIIRYHEQFASKAGYLHKLPQHKRLMNFNSPNSPSKDVKSTAKTSKAGVTASKTRSRQQTRNRDDVDFREDNIREEEEEQSSSSDNSDSDSDSNSSSSQATNKNLRHFSASSEQDSHDQSRNRIDSHTSPPTSPEVHNMVPPPHNRPRWEAPSKSLFSRTEELLRAAEMAQQGELRSFDMQEKSDQDNWSKELNQSHQNQEVFSSPGSNSNQQITDRSTTFDEQPSFRSPINEPQSARRRNLSSAIDVGSPTDVTQLLSSPHQTPAVSTDAFMKPPGHLQQEEEEVDDNPSTGTQPFSIQDHLRGMSSSSQFQPTANQSQPATPHTPTLSDLSMRTANPQPQQPPQESELLHKQAPKHQTLHHLPPPPPTGTLPASANQPSSTYDARFLQQFSNQQQQHQAQQKEAEKSYAYPNPYQSYLPSLPTPQQPQQQPASSYKYPPHYPWPSHYPYFSPSGGSSQSTNPLQKNQQDRQSAAVAAAAAGLSSSHLGQRSDTMPGAAGHHLSHGHSGLTAGASPLMHAHATQHVSPAHLQQYMMGGPAMMSHEHYLAQAAYGYDQNQQQALQFWQQQQQQHQKQQYSTGLPHGIHANPAQQLGAPTHPLGHASLWPTHHHLQQPSQFGKSTLFGGAQVGAAAKPQDSLFRLSSNQNNNNSVQGGVPMRHVYMGYTHFPRPELFGKQDGEPESWQPPVLKSSRYQQEGPTSNRLQGMVVEDRNRQFREEQCKKKNYNVATPQGAACDLDTLNSASSSSSNDSNSLSTSAILEQARKHSELIHAGMITTSTSADS